MKVNLNDHVRIRIGNPSDARRPIYRGHLRFDDDGFIKCQLHEAFREFGPLMEHHINGSPIEMDIEILPDPMVEALKEHKFVQEWQANNQSEMRVK